MKIIPKKPKISKKIVLFFLFILIIATFLRFQGVVTNSFPFTYDIGRDLLQAKDIATTLKVPLIGQTTGINGFFYGPWWYYFLSVLYYPLFGSPTLYTGFMAFLGVFTVVLSFGLGKKIGGLFFAFTFMSLLSFSNEIVGLTSQVWNPDLIPILWILTFFCIYFISQKKKVSLNFFILGILLGLNIDSEIVVGLLYVVGVLLSLLILIPKTFKPKNILFGILGFLVILLPRIIFDFRHQHILSKALINGLSGLSSNGTTTSVTPVPQKIDSIFALFSDTLANGNRIIGFVILILVCLLIIFFYKKTNKKAQFFTKFSVITTLVTILGLLFLGHDIWGHYFYMLPLLFIFITSLSLYFLFESQKYKYVAVSLALILIVLNLNIPQRLQVFSNPYWKGDASLYRNQLQVVDYVYQDAGTHDFKFIVYTPPVIDYTYRYLFLWEGENKFHKEPVGQNAKLLYVILEPDLQMPDRQKMWLKSREKDGKVVSTKKFESGIEVQTRLVN